MPWVRYQSNGSPRHHQAREDDTSPRVGALPALQGLLGGATISV